MTYDNLIFVRINDTAPTTGPDAIKGKNYWRVTGTADGSIPGYSSSYRYAEGTVVTHNGKNYKRTDYSPNGGQAPYSGSLYWELQP